MNLGANIEHCPLSYRCTQHWSELEPLPETEIVRFCMKCQAPVYLAADENELEEHARQRRCVAITRLKPDGKRVGRP
jgi:hypothetical protein